MSIGANFRERAQREIDDDIRRAEDQVDRTLDVLVRLDDEAMKDLRTLGFDHEIEGSEDLDAVVDVLSDELDRVDGEILDFEARIDRLESELDDRDADLEEASEFADDLEMLVDRLVGLRREMLSAERDLERDEEDLEGLLDEVSDVWRVVNESGVVREAPSRSEAELWAAGNGIIEAIDEASMTIRIRPKFGGGAFSENRARGPRAFSSSSL